MGRILDIVKERKYNLIEIFYILIKKQKEINIENAKKKYSEGLLEEKLDDIEHDYNFNMEKMECFLKMLKKDEISQRKMTRQIIYIDSLNIKTINKVESILTYITMYDLMPEKLENLNKEETFLLASSMIQVPIDSLKTYGKVLSEPTILDDILNKIEEPESQRYVMYELIDHCDDCVHENLKDDKIKCVINNCRTLIDIRANSEKKLAVK